MDITNNPSVYFFWSYHSPSKGVYDFETPGKNIQQLFDYAKEAGLWVITRAGPYCNVRIPPSNARKLRPEAADTLSRPRRAEAALRFGDQTAP
jgi:beta-galactosidase GanA